MNICPKYHNITLSTLQSFWTPFFSDKKRGIFSFAMEKKLNDTYLSIKNRFDFLLIDDDDDNNKVLEIY